MSEYQIYWAKTFYFIVTYEQFWSLFTSVSADCIEHLHLIFHFYFLFILIYGIENKIVGMERRKKITLLSCAFYFVCFCSSISFQWQHCNGTSSLFTVIQQYEKRCKQKNDEKCQRMGRKSKWTTLNARGKSIKKI